MDAKNEGFGIKPIGYSTPEDLKNLAAIAKSCLDHEGLISQIKHWASLVGVGHDNGLSACTEEKYDEMYGPYADLQAPAYDDVEKLETRSGMHDLIRTQNKSSNKIYNDRIY